MKSLRRLLARAGLGVLASTAVVLGQKMRALELYQRRLALDPNDAALHATVAALQMETGDPASACGQLRQLVSLHPNDAEAWFNLGFVLEQMDQHSSAEPCFRHASELDPVCDRAWYGLGLALIHCGRLTEAASALKRTTELQPLSPFGWYQLAMTEQQLGHTDEAWRLHQHLRGFEPRVAATLKRDLEAVGEPANAALSAAAGDSANLESDHRAVGAASIVPDPEHSWP